MSLTDCIERLIRKLAIVDGDPEATSSVLVELAGFGQPVVDELCHIMEDDNERHRASAAKAIGYLPHFSKVSAESRPRIDVIPAIHALHDLKFDAATVVAFEAANALLRIGTYQGWLPDEHSHEIIIESLSCEDPRVRATAAARLAFSDIPHATHALLEALNDPVEEVRLSAARSVEVRSLEAVAPD